MVANPEHHLEDFARAGADIISIHVEATPIFMGPFKNSFTSVSSLQLSSTLVRLLKAIKHVLHLVDQVLVMTVNPGFGGQASARNHG